MLKILGFIAIWLIIVTYAGIFILDKFDHDPDFFLKMVRNLAILLGLTQIIIFAIIYLF